MDLTISGDTRFGLETPTKASAPFIASVSVPFMLSLLVIFEISACAGFSYASPRLIIPPTSTIIRLPTPSFSRNFPIAIPAEPAPFITTVISDSFFPASFTAFSIAAPTTIAVPC